MMGDVPGDVPGFGAEGGEASLTLASEWTAFIWLSHFYGFSLMAKRLFM